MNFQLSEKAKELIPKARIVSNACWKNSHPPDIIELLQAADDQGRYLSDADLEKLQAHTCESGVAAARFLRDKAAEIVAEAREQVLAQYPDITKPSGDLYPPARAEACWRDFWHFLRCVTYGIAGGSTEFTSPEGLHYMQLLYQELRVPLDAMVLGLENLKAASLKRLPDRQQTLAPYFDRLVTQVSSCSSDVVLPEVR
jgi:hypothetical protein